MSIRDHLPRPRPPLRGLAATLARDWSHQEATIANLWDDPCAEITAQERIHRIDQAFMASEEYERQLFYLSLSGSQREKLDHFKQFEITAGLKYGAAIRPVLRVWRLDEPGVHSTSPQTAQHPCYSQIPEVDLPASVLTSTCRIAGPEASREAYNAVLVMGRYAYRQGLLRKVIDGIQNGKTDQQIRILLGLFE